MKKLLLFMLFTVLFAMSCANEPDDSTPLDPSVNMNEGLDELWSNDSEIKEYFDKSDVTIDSAESLLNALRNPEHPWDPVTPNSDYIYANDTPEGINKSEVELKWYPLENIIFNLYIDVIGNKENIYMFYNSIEDSDIEFSLVFIKDNGYGKVVNIPRFSGLNRSEMGFEDISSHVSKSLSEEGKESLGENYDIFVWVTYIVNKDISTGKYFEPYGKGKSIFAAQKK